MTYPQIHQYKITLHYIQPPIWRQFQIEDDVTFEDLHEAIQIIMGWTMSHLYAFNIKQQMITDEETLRVTGENGFGAEQTLLNELVNKVGTKFSYTYDFGDSWKHEVVLEQILPTDPEQVYPFCLGGARACPPEDCGGVPGYMEIIETLKKPKSKAYAALMEWLDEDYDPEFFDLTEVNRKLRDSFAWNDGEWENEE